MQQARAWPISTLRFSHSLSMAESASPCVK